MKNIITLVSATLATIAFIAFAVFFAYSVVTWETRCDADTWNNGICYCGGEYEFSNATKRDGAGNFYFYHCEDCGYVIRTYHAQRKN